MRLDGGHVAVDEFVVRFGSSFSFAPRTVSWAAVPCARVGALDRCLGPFLVETCALVEEGVGLEQLDKVMKAYGLPVGPITLADEVRNCSRLERCVTNSNGEDACGRPDCFSSDSTCCRNRS